MKDTITSRQYEIMQAAGRLLTQSGVSGLTIKNLAREMKFSESAIYRHFQGKEDIIIAMLDYLAENMDKRIAAAVSEDQSIEENLMAIFDSQFSFFEKNPFFVVAVFSDGLMEESNRVNECITKIMSIKSKYLFDLIAKGQSSGTFVTSITPDKMLHIVISSVRLLMFKWRVNQFQFDIKKEGKSLLKSVLTLIKK